MTAMRRFAEAGNALLRVACGVDEGTAAERIVGFCIVHLEQTRRGTVGYVVTLDVAPAWRGRGIARALLAELEREAAQAGARAMSLHVFTGNARAIQLYERLGYQSGRTQGSFYGTGLDARVYSRPLMAGAKPGADSDDAQRLP